MGRWARWLERQRRDGLLLPPTWPTLWLGLAIAVVGPMAITPLVRSDPLSVFPGVPYVFVIVAATVFGRLVAAGVAVVVSTVLLDRYIVGELLIASERPRSELWAIVAFVVIAIVVVQLLVGRDRSVTLARRERDRLSFLGRTGDAMSGALAVDEVVRRLGAVIVPELADWFSVDLVEDGEIRNLLVVHPDPGRIELARELQRRFPTDPDATTGAPHVIRTGRPELTETIPDAMLEALIEDPDLLATMRGLGLRCAICVPLTARDRTFGALTLVGAESHDRYDAEDLHLAEEIADRAALAIDTARLFAAEETARRAATREADRNRVLKDVTAAFGWAATVDEIMAAMLEDGIRGAGAVAGTVGIVDGDRVDLVGMTGYEPDDDPFWHDFGIDDPLPLADAIRGRRSVVVLTTSERDEAYPVLRGRGEQRDHALVCLPLLLGDDAIGGFSASYPPGSGFGPDDLAFLRSLGEQCAQAIDRARARGRAARAQSRFDALADASRSLAGTLDLAGTVRTILRLARELFGPVATVVEPAGRYLRVLGVDTETGVTVEEEAAEMDVPVPAAVAACLAGEGAQVVPAGDGAMVAFPLTIAERTSAVLVVGDPTFDAASDEEMTFAREVVRRMARALENARLYRERDYVARTLQRTLLPASLPDVPGVEIEALFLPAVHRYEIGGDFYDVFPVGDDRWAAVVGDVCGKGVEAASLTGLARHTLRAVAEHGSPGEALGALNRALIRERLDGRFCTVAYVEIAPLAAGGARLTVASGGHPLPQRRDRTGRIEQVGSYGTLLGVTEDIRIVEDEVRLDPGDALVLFTDGLLAKDEPSGDEPAGLLEAMGIGGSAAQISDSIQAYVDRLIADAQADDIAVLILRGVDRP